MQHTKILPIIFLLLNCTPVEIITTEIAEANAKDLLSDLKIDYNGVHCGESTPNYGRHNYVKCDATTKTENIKMKCKMHSCEIVEKFALRIKLGLMK